MRNTRVQIDIISAAQDYRTICVCLCVCARCRCNNYKLYAIHERFIFIYLMYSISQCGWMDDDDGRQQRYQRQRQQPAATYNLTSLTGWLGDVKAFLWHTTICVRLTSLFFYLFARFCRENKSCMQLI